MHALGVRKGVLFREVSSVQGCPYSKLPEQLHRKYSESEGKVLIYTHWGTEPRSPDHRECFHRCCC